LLDVAALERVATKARQPVLLRVDPTHRLAEHEASVLEDLQTLSEQPHHPPIDVLFVTCAGPVPLDVLCPHTLWQERVD
jgi:hypothetical protein